MHAATMVPITAAFLAGLAGLFVVTGAADGDRRLVLAGFRAREVLAGRLGVIAAAADQRLRGPRRRGSYAGGRLVGVAARVV